MTTRQERIRAWLEGLPQGLAVTQELVDAVSRASVPSQLRGLLSKDVLRSHADELEVLLGDDAPAAPSQARSTLGPPSVGYAPFTAWGSSAHTEVRFSRADRGGIRLSWDAPSSAAAVRIYRVSAHDDFVPINPDDSRLVVATWDTEAVDPAPFVSAKRHFAVWLNQGPDEASAMAAQAQPWAVGTCVLPVRDVHLSVVDNQVSGTWSAAEGVARVEVHRLPADGSTSEEVEASLYGFEDRPAPGQWIYRIHAFAWQGGQLVRSPMVEQAVTVAAVLPRITDLAVREDPRDPGFCTLTWTGPWAADVSVSVHRHPEPLEASITSRVLDGDAMNRYGLTPDTRVNQPAVEIDGQLVVERVALPARWPRTHFTVVTRSRDADEFQVGNSAVFHRAGAVTEAKLVERIDEEFITFGWPDGADFVRVFQGARGVEVDDVNTLSRLAEMSHQEYQRLGGAHLERLLPPDGCSIHLVGVSYQGGRPKEGPVRTLDYPGLVRLRYQLTPTVSQASRKGFFTRRNGGAVQRGLRLSVTSEVGVESVRLALVHHPRRLPLYPGEGTTLLEGEVALPPGQEVVLKEHLDGVVGLAGFVRLFVVVPEAELGRYAVLDPSIDQLRCS